MEKEVSEMTIKEFMEWFISEYENKHLLPSEYDHTIDRLEGYSLAKKDTDESFILESALELLREAQNFLRVIKQYSNWKYK